MKYKVYSTELAEHDNRERESNFLVHRSLICYIAKNSLICPCMIFIKFVLASTLAHAI